MHSHNGQRDPFKRARILNRARVAEIGGLSDEGMTPFSIPIACHNIESPLRGQRNSASVIGARAMTLFVSHDLSLSPTACEMRFRSISQL